MTDPVAPPDQAPAPEPPADRQWGDVAAVLVLCLLPSLHAAFADLVWPQLAPRRPPVVYFETLSLVQMAGWVALALILIRRSGRPPREFGFGRPEWGPDMAVAGGLVVLLYAVGGRIAGLFPEADPAHDPAWQSLPPAPVTPMEYVLTVVGCLGVGLGEEAVWRAYLLTRLEAVTGSGVATWLATSALFGLNHLYQGPAGVANAVGMGLLLGGAFYWQRRVWAVAVAHGMYDALLMLTQG